MNQRPVIRFIETIPIEHEQERMVMLQDPDRLMENTMVVSIPAFMAMTLMDGERTISQICGEFKNQFQQTVTEDEINGLVRQLDDALLLDNDRYQQAINALREEFLAQPSRPPYFAGKSYPDDKAELSGQIEKLLDAATPAANGALAVIVPHIDFRVGADMMAAGWSAVRDSDAEVVVILGIGHTLGGDFFSCIDKDFATPVGDAPVDSAFLGALEKNFGESIYGHAESHRNEHSIEFQTLFFAHLKNRKSGVTFVPILLSFPEMIWDIDHPVFNGERVEKFIEALKKTASDDGRKIIYVASVDFSHVGARFGDQGKLDDEKLKQIEDDDRELAGSISEMDQEGFLKKITATNQANRVCGFPALYTLLKVAGADNGELIEYRQNIEGDRETVVSFATMILRGGEGN